MSKFQRKTFFVVKACAHLSVNNLKNSEIGLDLLLSNSWSLLQCQMDRHLLSQKVSQRISVMKTNILYVSRELAFNSRFVLKITQTPVFVFITEIL